MKRFPFLSMALMAILAVVAVGCTLPQNTQGGYYEEPVGHGGYYGSPYGSNVIVVERDPYTGRYYQVSPYGGYGYGYPRGGVYAAPHGGRVIYDNRGGNTRYNNNVRNGGSYRSPDVQQQQQQREQQRQAEVRQMESTKESILGKKRD